MKNGFLKTGVLALTALTFALTGFSACEKTESDKKTSYTPNNSTYTPNNGGSTGGTTTPTTPTVSGSKEIVIKLHRGSYGSDWLYELEEKFETLYAAQGYTVKIRTPDFAAKGNAIIQELVLGYDQVGVDLYITRDVTPDQVGFEGDYGILVEDIQGSVYDQPAIAYDGTYEEKTVGEKVSSDVMPFVTDSTGATYGFNWAQASGGLAVNTRKLAEYGLEVPNTTNEMFDCFDKIYCGYNGIENSDISGTYPITYIPNGNSYSLYFLYTLMAQYDGSYFDKFWSFQTTSEEGFPIDLSDAECIDTYNDPAMLEMLKVAYRTFDLMLSAPGTLQQGVEQAQAKLMGDTDDAVFMFNGDWMLNELKISHRDKLNDIDFVNYPVVSALGTKLFGTGTSYNLDEENCDELLSYIIDLVDENKEIDEIVADVKTNKGIEVAAEDVAEVARARGVTYSRGVEFNAYIPKNSEGKEVASLFLRMMASDDFGRTFNENANAATPYYAQENTTSEYAFVRNASKITANKYFSSISLANGASGYRKQLNLQSFFTTQSHIPDYISCSSTASIYNANGKRNGKGLDVYTTAAEKLISEEIANLETKWEQYKANGNYL